MKRPVKNKGRSYPVLAQILSTGINSGTVYENDFVMISSCFSKLSVQDFGSFRSRTRRVRNSIPQRTALGHRFSSTCRIYSRFLKKKSDDAPGTHCPWSTRSATISAVAVVVKAPPLRFYGLRCLAAVVKGNTPLHQGRYAWTVSRNDPLAHIKHNFG